jgi:hypothetical protein
MRAAIELLADGAAGPTVRASLSGDRVAVSFDPGEAVPEAVYSLVLVQDEQEHKGGNGIVYHKMVVRDLLTVDPKGPRTARFDLAASERAADEYLSAFERTYSRIPNFKWAVRRNTLPRRGLKVVFFLQDGSAKSSTPPSPRSDSPGLTFRAGWRSMTGEGARPAMERYRILPHTADGKFQAFGRTLEEAFGNAALAMASLMWDWEKVGRGVRHFIHVKAIDREQLLKFLTEPSSLRPNFLLGRSAHPPEFGAHLEARSRRSLDAHEPRRQGGHLQRLKIEEWRLHRPGRRRHVRAPWT